MTATLVISAGQCSFDNSRLQSLIERAGGSMQATNSIKDTIQSAQEREVALILINRVFDRTNESGLSAIEELKKISELSQIPLMLISNYPDYQHEAVTRGAVPGFGKDDLHNPGVVNQLKAYLTP